jgi:serine/threonine-protein kinase
MAPEQFFDTKNIDVRTDIYSVGAMAYELLAGRLPIEASSYTDMIMKIRTEKVTPLAEVVPAIPAPLAAAIEKALAQEPAGRWATPRDFAQALRGAAALVAGAPPLVPVAAGKAKPAAPRPVKAPAAVSSSAPSSIVIADDVAPPSKPAAPAPAKPPGPAQVAGSPQKAAAILDGPLMPKPQAAVAKGRGPMFWVLVAGGILLVMLGTCAVRSFVARGMNQAGMSSGQ